MCGICGIIDPEFKRPVDLNQLTGMRDILHHRGPDKSTLMTEPGIGFGHTRLSIIDLVSGDQPVQNEDGSLSVILNGEIYNYIELRKHLVSAGHCFSTQSDTEVIAHLYEDNGPDFLKDLRGMFSIALWDRKRKRVILARDQFGIKPLYYLQLGGLLYFASEPKSLFSLENYSPEFDPDGLYFYLKFQFYPEDTSLFKDIQKVRPGEYLLIENGTVKRVQYWRPEPAPYSGSEEDFIEQYRSFFTRSVEIQMRSDVPVGAHLSGGLDSSSIVHYLAGNRRDELHTFSVGFDRPGAFNDTETATRSASTAGTHHHNIIKTARDFQEKIEDIFYYMDEPQAADGLIGHYFLSELAKDKVRVTLNGQGADELSAGYARYLVLQLMEGPAKTGFSEELISQYPVLSRYRPLIRKISSPSWGNDPIIAYFRMIDRFHSLESSDNQWFQKSDEFAIDWLKSELNKIGNYDILTLIQIFEMRHSLVGMLMAEDRMSMAHSIESRCPFLDVDLANLCLSIPSSFRIRNGVLKYIQRQAVKQFVPDFITNRSDKIGFPVPVAQWISNSIPQLYNDLQSGYLVREGIVPQEIFTETDPGTVTFDRRLWGILSLEMIIKLFKVGL